MHHTKGTENFVRNFDKFFYCLNGHYESQGQHKRKDALLPYENVDDPRFKVSHKLQHVMLLTSIYVILYILCCQQIFIFL